MRFPIKLERKKIEFSNNGYNLFFFPSDPSVFWVSPIVEEIFDLAETQNKESIIKTLSGKYNHQAICKAFDEIDSVERIGFFNKGMRNLWKKAEFPRNIKDRRIRSINLHTTHDCNLACNYCYAGKGTFGLKMPERFMSWDVAKRAIDWFFDINKHADYPLAICFFGGEPLLNIEVIEKVLKYIETEKKPKYPNNILLTTMTNGVLLKEDKVAKVLAKYYVKPTISIDASRKEHDKNRPYKNGNFSYDDIILGIKKLKALAPDLPIVTRSTIDFDSNLKGFFYRNESLGALFSEFSIKRGILSKGKESSDFLERIKKEFLKYNQDVVTRKKRPAFGSSMLLQFFHGNLVAGETCGTGIERFSVTPNGEIHICSGVMLDRKTTYLGDVYKGLIKERLKRVYDIHASKGAKEYRSRYCSNCWARNHCVGICVLSKAMMPPSAKEGDNPACDYLRMTAEFSILSYTFMGSEDLSELARYNTADRSYKKDALSISEKVKLLDNVRKVYNENFKYLKPVTPTMPH